MRKTEKGDKARSSRLASSDNPTFAENNRNKSNVSTRQNVIPVTSLAVLAEIHLKKPEVCKV